jgi:iron complex transport system substrate-binding protein
LSLVLVTGLRDDPRSASPTASAQSARCSTQIPKIIELQPDLVLTFSDLQADIVAALVRQGVNVHAFNQRTVAEIFDMIRMLGAMTGAADRADRLVDELTDGLALARQQAAHLPRRPRVYFEEWDEPMISGIGWVSELIEAAGGVDIFSDRAGGKSAKE